MNTYCEHHSPKDLPDYISTLHEFAFYRFSWFFFLQENLKPLFCINAVGKMSFLFIEDFKGIKRSDIGLLKSPYFNMSFLFEGNGKSFDWVKTDLGCMPAKKYTDTKLPAIQTYPFIAF